MASADTSQSILRFLEESSWGVIPASAMTELRFTGESLKVDLQTTQSEEIRSDRQITDLITTKVEASGGINGEFSYQAYDDFLAAALYTDWADTSYTAATISAQANAIVLPGSHGQNFTAGDVVVASGFAAGGLNTSYTVAFKTTNALVLTTALSTTEAAGASVTLTRSYTSTSISIDSQVITLPGGHGQTFTIGDVIRMTGWSTAGNNDTNFTLTNVSGNDLTVASGLTNDAGGESVTISRIYTSTGISAEKNCLELASGHGQTFVAGQALKVTGFTGTAGNNDVYTIASKTAVRLRLNEAVVNDAAGESVTLTAHVLTNGVTRKSYVLEKEFTDLSKLIIFTGMVVSSMNVNIEAQNKITCGFNFLGKTGTTDTETAGTGSPTAAPTYEVMNAGDNVGDIKADGSTLALIKSISMDLNNNLRGKPEVGVVGNGEIGSGRIALTGNLSMYFQDFTIYDKYINSDSMSLQFQLIDGDGAGRYVVTLPKVKFTKGDIVAGGPDQDVMVDGGYQALRDPSTGYTVIITRV